MDFGSDGSFEKLDLFCLRLTLCSSARESGLYVGDFHLLVTREIPGVALVNCAISHIFTIISTFGKKFTLSHISGKIVVH